MRQVVGNFGFQRQLSIIKKGANDAKGGSVGTNEVSNRDQVFKTKLRRKPRMGQR